MKKIVHQEPRIFLPLFSLKLLGLKALGIQNATCHDRGNIPRLRKEVNMLQIDKIKWINKIKGFAFWGGAFFWLMKSLLEAFKMLMWRANLQRFTMQLCPLISPQISLTSNFKLIFSQGSKCAWENVRLCFIHYQVTTSSSYEVCEDILKSPHRKGNLHSITQDAPIT